MKYRKLLTALYLYGITEDGVYIINPETYDNKKQLDSTLRLLSIGDDYLKSLSPYEWKIYCNAHNYNEFILYTNNYIVLPAGYEKNVELPFGKHKINDTAVYMYRKQPIKNLYVSNNKLIFYNTKTIQISPTKSLVPCLYKQTYLDVNGTLTSLTRLLGEDIDEIIYSASHTHFIIVRKNASIYLLHAYIKSAVDITKLFNGNPHEYRIQSSLSHILLEYDNDFKCIILDNNMTIKYTKTMKEVIPEIYDQIKDPTQIRVYQSTDHPMITIGDISHVYEMIYITPPTMIKTKSLFLKM
jgi:hypothetical protein